MNKLTREFYTRNVLEVSKDLLGKLLVYNNDDKRLIGKIVEVEAYMGPKDKAAHSYGGKVTERTKVMYKEGGYVYMFLIYGMYYCFNIVAAKENEPYAILVRGIEPVENIELMSRNRYEKNYEELTAYQKRNLSNGPGKLCKAMKMDKSLNGEDLCGDKIYILETEDKDFNIVSSKRIGIDYAEEAKDFLWRFYIKGNKYVSKT